jgi:Fe-S-cluster-containing hydrogenase component 2
MSLNPMRAIVKIDEEKCDGCGACVPSCAEGAIKIIDGKARLVADNLCDGLGNCLGTCPRGAITIEHRAADAFDEEVMHVHLSHAAHAAHAARAVEAPAAACGCPGAALRNLRPVATTRAHEETAAASQLGHWPVQLHLLPVEGQVWQDADVLIAADCVGFAMPDFHGRLLAGKTLAVGCPKLDDVAAYVAKLAQVFVRNPVRSVTVAHMEVPCCTGIVAAVRQALAQAGRTDLRLRDITVGVDGRVVGTYVENTR